MGEIESISDSLLARVQIYSDKLLDCVLLSDQSEEPKLQIYQLIKNRSIFKAFQKAWESVGRNVVRLILCPIY